MATENWQKIGISLAVAAIVILIVGVIAWFVINGDGSLLRNVAFGSESITPNADGDSDIVAVQYEISRNAVVSIYFESEAGERFYFRRDRPRGVGEYNFFFSGIVEPFDRDGDIFDGEVVSRLLPDGSYTWTIEATDFNGVTESTTGRLEVVDADLDMPELRDFQVYPSIFTPNRDGIDDRVEIQYFQTKQADVRVFLQLPDGGEIPIGELERDVETGAPGRHYYDFEGGVDNGETPPEDGTYTIVAIAEDEEGQKIRVEETLTIEDGGVPRADVFAPPAGDTFEVSATAVALCQTIFFTVTVENYGNTIIRTTGPEPGTIYDNSWNYNTLGWHTESGAWRVGIGFENELANYPYRWAVGNDDVLIEKDGFKYLEPGKRAIVTGGVRVTGPFGERNPQPMWVGLIHEDVEISQFNNRVDPKAILVDMPDQENLTDCEPREIPVRVLDQE